MRLRAFFVIFLFLPLLTPLLAVAESTGNYWVTGGMGASLIGVELLPDPASASWSGGILFDDPVRSGLRAGTPEGRYTADVTSNWLLLGVGVSPFAAAIAGGQSVASSVHWAADALLFDVVITEGTKRLAARERPGQRECRLNGQCDGDLGSEKYKSFLSGHASITFTAAGLLCSPGFRSSAGISVSAGPYLCGASVGLAGLTGILRIVADRHWSSDVLAGAALGFVSGFWIPEALSPRRRNASGGRENSALLSPQLDPGGLGIRYSFLF